MYNLFEEIYIEQETTPKPGKQRIIDLKTELNDLLAECDNLFEKEKIRQAYRQVHRFILRKCLDQSGRQAISVYDHNSMIDISGFINKMKKGDPLYDSHETEHFLGKEHRCPYLTQFLVEVLKEINFCSNELAKVKRIYDLVASCVPGLNTADGEGGEESSNDYSFEVMLRKGIGTRAGKNALLVFAVRQAGIEAYLCSIPEGSFVRIFTFEGVFETNVAESRPFNLKKLSTKGLYHFYADKSVIDDLPGALEWVASERPNHTGRFHVFIKLDSEEAEKYISQINSIPLEELKKILASTEKVKYHPLYDLASGDCITPQTAGKYADYLFK